MAELLGLGRSPGMRRVRRKSQGWQERILQLADAAYHLGRQEMKELCHITAWGQVWTKVLGVWRFPGCRDRGHIALTAANSHREKAPKEKARQPALHQRRQGPTDEAQMAAAAALARLEQKQPRARGPTSQDSIRNQVRKELEAEATVRGSPVAPGTNEVPGPKEEDSTQLPVSGVYFTCPLTGATLRRDQRDTHIKEAILLHFSTNPVAASIMKIHTFNRDQDKVKLAVDTIAKYLDNIHLHPEEEKYQRIKLHNKVFQERITCLEGTQEFFEAIGFQKMLLPVPDQEGAEEEFYVLSEAARAQPQNLVQHREQLLAGEPVRAQLDRQLRVFRPSPLASHFNLPGDFFSLTAEELKREQRLRADAVERLSVLRTKAMREKEEQRDLRKYNYTVLRVRLPDGCLLQGTFYARERLSALYEFIRGALQSDWLPFELLASGGQKLVEDENVALNECGLVPSALLTFSWDAAVVEDIRAAGAELDSSILKPELLEAIEQLS
ncbi:UBX domain-containing protein 6 isoform X3 [Heterocephalus glaber]|uniref:UBX domain-containing protein 6 n=1 Tax=Heterocephalus glaber TaxID=10181 RepID=A0AAX6RVY0_HETGA|nr:UBX domain-containing protein 6 isoform X3 [Heterocephalus glaber]